MKRLSFCTVIGVFMLSISGCGTSLNSMQKTEYSTWESKGILVKDKDPGTAAALGLLPGGGSFYNGEAGLGIVNLLLWPSSILWEPIGANETAKAKNYFVTKTYLAKKQNSEISELEDEMMAGKITKDKYLLEKKKIQEKYSGGLE